MSCKRTFVLQRNKEPHPHIFLFLSSGVSGTAQPKNSPRETPRVGKVGLFPAGAPCQSDIRSSAPVCLRGGKLRLTQPLQTAKSSDSCQRPLRCRVCRNFSERVLSLHVEGTEVGKVLQMTLNSKNKVQCKV